MTWFKVIDDSGLVSQSRPAYLFGALFGALALLMVYNLLRFAYTVSYTHIWLSLLHGALLACAMANLGVLAVWLPGLTYSQPLIADLSALAASCALLGYTLGFFNQRRRTWITWLLGIELNVVLAIAASILLGQWLWHSWLIYSLVLVASCSALVVALYHWRQGYQRDALQQRHGVLHAHAARLRPARPGLADRRAVQPCHDRRPAAQLRPARTAAPASERQPHPIHRSCSQQCGAQDQG